MGGGLSVMHEKVHAPLPTPCYDWKKVNPFQEYTQNQHVYIYSVVKKKKKIGGSPCKRKIVPLQQFS